MWSQVYRNHALIPFPSYDTAEGAWAAQIAISWWTESFRGFEFVRFPDRLTTENEAVTCALQRGQAWVDQQLQVLAS